MAEENTPVTDPVCGKEVPEGAVHSFSFEYAGRLYTFCSASCKRAFILDPAHYQGAPREIRRGWC